MVDVFLKMLVACDRRRNPVVGLAGRSVSDFGRSLGNLARSLGELASKGEHLAAQRPSSMPSYASYVNAKPLLAVSPSGRVVDVSGATSHHAPVVLKYSKMPLRQVPDYTGGVRNAVARLGEKYDEQRKVVYKIRERIDSCERINLEELGCEINRLHGEIDKCKSSEGELIKKRQGYRAEGVLRYVFVHGLALHSLSCQIARLHEKETSLTTKQNQLMSLVAQRESFDFTTEKGLLKTQEEKLAELEQDYKKRNEFCDSLDRQMKRFVDSLADTTNRLNAEIENYNTLSRYEAQLNAAANAYERRLVHQECEANFGDGSIGRLRSRVLSRIRGLSDRYDKQKRQAENHAREIGLLG